MGGVGKGGGEAVKAIRERKRIPRKIRRTRDDLRSRLELSIVDEVHACSTNLRARPLAIGSGGRSEGSASAWALMFLARSCLLANLVSVSASESVVASVSVYL